MTLKLKVWEDSKEEDSDKQLYLRLEESGAAIIVYVVDKKGERMPNGDILAIGIEHPHQCITLFEGLSPDVPLKTDMDGYVLVRTSMDLKIKIEKEAKAEFVERERIIKSQIKAQLEVKAKEEAEEKTPCH